MMVHGWWPEVGGQSSEFRVQRSEVRGQRLAVGGWAGEMCGALVGRAGSARIAWGGKNGEGL